MLRYLGTGERWYGRRPQPVYHRRDWEFQAVIAGQLQLQTEQGVEPPRQRTLWVLPPAVGHGWTGSDDDSCEVIVLHFVEVPSLLVEACRGGDGWLTTSLTDADIDHLRSLVAIADAELRQPSALSVLQHQRLQIELTILGLRDCRDLRPPGASAAARQTVENAIAWFGEHLAEGPTLAEVAAAVYVSPAHLRRLFHQVLERSPRQALDQIRFQRAMQLLESGRLTMEAVAVACGLGSASALSRAFKKWHGRSPREWLRGRQPPAQVLRRRA